MPLRVLLPLIAPALADPAGAQESAGTAPALEQGRTLFTAIGSRNTYLVDAAGQEVHVWRSELPSSGPVVLLENGHLLRGIRVAGQRGFSAGGQGGRIQEIAPDGRVTWDFTLADERLLQHHDFEPTPYGTLLLIAWERMSVEEATAAGRDPERIGPYGLWPDCILEVEPLPPDGGRVVWEWHARDHLVQERFPERANHGAVAAHPGRIDINADLRAPPEPAPDLAELRALGYAGAEEERAAAPARPGGPPADWLHTNAIAYDSERDLVLLCSRKLSEVWVIDHSTTTDEAAGRTGGSHGKGGDLLARYGNTEVHGAGTQQDRRLFHPHDAHWIRHGLPGYGNVLVFDNGPRPELGEVSHVLEFRLEVPPAGTEASTAPTEPRGDALEWSCTTIGGQRFFSSHISGAQRLENGNTLVTIGAEARVVEVTRDGELAWEYVHAPRPEDQPRAERPHEVRPEAGEAAHAGRIGIFRATRLPADHPGVATLLRDRAESADSPR